MDTQLTHNDDIGLQWNSAKTSVAITNSFSQYWFDGNSYYNSLVNIDASAFTGKLQVFGNRYDNVIKAASGGGIIDGDYGDDIIYLGKGYDELHWYANKGNDIVYNFDLSKDDIIVYEDSYNDDKMSPTSISGGFLIPSTRWSQYLHRR